MLIIAKNEPNASTFALQIEMNNNQSHIKVTKVNSPILPAIKKSIQDKKKWIEEFQSQDPEKVKINKSKRFI